MYKNVPESVIICTYMSAVASYHHKVFAEYVKDYKLPNGMVSDAGRALPLYKELDSALNKSFASAKKVNSSYTKCKEKIAYRKEWRNSTMMMPLVRTEKFIADEMFESKIIYDYDSFKVRFLAVIMGEYYAQKERIAQQ